MPYLRALTLLPSQQVLIVEEGETILDAALRAGLNLPHSCKGGHCSSCRARIRAGDVVYPRGRPLGLLAEEEREGYALLCQAHAAERGPGDRSPRDPSAAAGGAGQEPALPHRAHAPARARGDGRVPAPAGERRVPLRRRAVPGHHAAAEPAPQFFDRELPGARRADRAAHPQGRERRVHAAAVRRHEREDAAADRRPARPVLVPAGVAATGLADRRRHRLCAAALDAARPAGSRRSSSAAFVLGRAVAARTCTKTSRCARSAPQHPNLRYTPVLSEAQPSDDWTGRRGLVHAAALEDHPRLQDFDVYASGPPAMVEAVRHEFIERGLPAQQLFFDSFDYAPDALARLGASAPS